LRLRSGDEPSPAKPEEQERKDIPELPRAEDWIPYT